MLHLTSSLLITFLSCFLSPRHACNQLDYTSLSTFFFQLSSAALNWSSNTDCCFWEGIHCNNGGRVTHLSLPQRGLNGPINPSLGNLAHLSYINLSHNHLFGELPSSLLSSHVKVIDLSSNQLHGELSPSFFRFTENLISFNISSNSFTGPLPFSICDGSHFIGVLDFSHNGFSGHILPGLGKCSRLKQFRADFNNLSGSLPEDLYYAKTLEVLSLSSNKLSGPIGGGIISLTNLTILELSVNQLNGSIPGDIGKLTKLEHLILSDNHLTGFLPSSLMNCTNLSTLNLRFNFLEGQLSKFNFSALFKLRILDVGSNGFVGRLPFGLYSCKSLVAIRLSANQLEGQISPKILALKSLSFLMLSYNKLTNISDAVSILKGCMNLEVLALGANFLNETLPNDINVEPDGFKNLKFLSLKSSQLNGPMPAWLAKLTKLVYLNLAHNRISGSIPQWLGTLPNLFFIDLSTNVISGQLIKELFQLPALASKQCDKQLEGSHLELPIIYNDGPALRQTNQLCNLQRGLLLGSNSLAGPIPIEIGQLKGLQVLELPDNNLSGNIPNQISELIELEVLDLSGNNLTGVIPNSLNNLSFLSYFSVANNNLRGQIPSGGQFDTFSSSSFEGNQGLCGSILNRSCNHQPKPRITAPTKDSKSSNNELVYGLIAGVVFGFIIGIAGGLLCPIHKLKFVQRVRFYKSIPFKWL